MNTIQRKICLLGHFSVGKTSLIRRFVQDTFDVNYKPTIGVHLSEKSVIYNNGTSNTAVHFVIWDLAGGERFDLVGPRYLQGASGALVVCDLTNAHTSEQMMIHAQQLKDHQQHAKFIFVGNKIDLRDQWVVSADQLRTLGQNFDADIILTSAKTGYNVDKAFQMLASRLC